VHQVILAFRHPFSFLRGQIQSVFLLSATVPVALLSCGAGCPQGRALGPDGVCLREDVLDFVACVGAAGGKSITHDDAKRISAAAQAVGARAEWQTSVRAEYGAPAEENQRVVIDQCIAMTSLTATATPPPTTPPTAVAAEPGTPKTTSTATLSDAAAPTTVSTSSSVAQPPPGTLRNNGETCVSDCECASRECKGLTCVPRDFSKHPELASGQACKFDGDCNSCRCLGVIGRVCQ
jgi:hypothetical protein